MTATDSGLPAATRRALAVVAVAAVAVCALLVPSAGVGFVCGAVGGWAIVGLVGSNWRAFLGGLVLPLAVAGALGGTVLVTSTAYDIGIGLSCLLLGASMVGLLTRVDLETKLLTNGLLLTAFVGFGAAGLALAFQGVGPAGLVEDSPSIAQLFSMTLIAVGVVGVAALAAPPTLYGQRSDETRRRRAYTITALAVLFVCGWLLVALASGFPATAAVVEGVLYGTRFQLAVAAIATIGGWLAVLSFLTRMAWYGPDERTTRNPAVSVLLGATIGFVLVSGAYAREGTATAAEQPLWVVLAASALVIGGGVLASTQLGKLRETVGSAAGTSLAVTLVVTGIGLGATIEGGPGAVASARGLATLGTIAAGVFAYAATRRGVTLANEMTSTGATRRAQFVTLGWVGALAVGGILVAIVGLGVGAVLTPALPGTATAAVVIGVLALAGVGWSLTR